MLERDKAAPAQAVSPRTPPRSSTGANGDTLLEQPLNIISTNGDAPPAILKQHAAIVLRGLTMR